MYERKSFEEAIEKNRYDQTTRLVFADWLEENGFDDEALVQRNWTPEWQQSYDWLEDIAKHAGETCDNYSEYTRSTEQNLVESKWRSVTTNDLIQAGHDYVKHGNYFVQQGHTWLINNLYNQREEFWKHWEVVTGIKVDENTKTEAPFSCSC